MFVVLIEDSFNADVGEEVGSFGKNIRLTFLFAIVEVVGNGNEILKGFTDVDGWFGEEFVVVVDDSLDVDVDGDFDSFGKDWRLFVLLLIGETMGIWPLL